jgi:hypothetical protein
MMKPQAQLSVATTARANPVMRFEWAWIIRRAPRYVGYCSQSLNPL